MRNEIPEGLRNAYDYLADGGLGEVIGFTSLALAHGDRKVESDTDVAMVLCLLADEALKTRRAETEE